MKSSMFTGMLIGLFLFITIPNTSARSFQSDESVVCISKERIIVSEPVVVLGSKNPTTKIELVMSTDESTNKEDSAQGEREPRNKSSGHILPYILKINGP